MNYSRSESMTNTLSMSHSPHAPLFEGQLDYDSLLSEDSASSLGRSSWSGIEALQDASSEHFSFDEEELNDASSTSMKSSAYGSPDWDYLQFVDAEHIPRAPGRSSSGPITIRKQLGSAQYSGSWAPSIQPSFVPPHVHAARQHSAEPGRPRLRSIAPM